MKKVTRENIRRRYERNQSENEITAGSVGSDSLDKIIVARLNGSKSLTTFSISSCSSKDRSILISIAFFTLGSIKAVSVSYWNSERKTETFASSRISGP
jgi:hypothetical protein